jgi:high-affinity iron transporter
MDLINLFNIPTFFIVLRETLECTMILSILFSLLDRLTQLDDRPLIKTIRKRIWIGIGIGFFTSIIIGAIFVTIFYVIEKETWERTNGIWGKKRKII